MTLTIRFTGPSEAQQTANELAPGTYFGTAGDFASVYIVNPGAGYQINVYNGDATNGWGFPVFVMTKNDGAPTDVLGGYSGGGGTAVVGD